jgi:hypothetical protein
MKKLTPTNEIALFGNKYVTGKIRMRNRERKRGAELLSLPEEPKRKQRRSSSALDKSRSSEISVEDDSERAVEVEEIEESEEKEEEEEEHKNNNDLGGETKKIISEESRPRDAHSSPSPPVSSSSSSLLQQFQNHLRNSSATDPSSLSTQQQPQRKNNTNISLLSLPKLNLSSKFVRFIPNKNQNNFYLDNRLIQATDTASMDISSSLDFWIWIDRLSYFSPVSVASHDPSLLHLQGNEKEMKENYSE